MVITPEIGFRVYIIGLYSLVNIHFYRRSNQASIEWVDKKMEKSIFHMLIFVYTTILLSHAFSFIFYLLFYFFLWDVESCHILFNIGYMHMIWTFLPLCKLNNISNRKKWIEKLWKISINRTSYEYFGIYIFKNEKHGFSNVEVFSLYFLCDFYKFNFFFFL